MEPLLPKSARTVLLDGTSVPVQHIRGGTNPAKLPAPSYGRLVVSRRQLGAPIYRSTTDFAVTGPHIRSPDLTYNCLHDPNLRDYFNQPGRLEQLKKENFITEDNEVICSLRQYNAHEGYLRDLKMLADRDFDELWREKMELMVELQRKGLISEDVWIDDMIDHVLEERTKDFRALIKKDAAKKMAKRRAETGEDELSEDDEDLAIEVALLDWQAEIRRRLAPFEMQLRHQRNRERHYQALQEERERKKAASEERWRATFERRVRQKADWSNLVLEGCKMVPQQETFPGSRQETSPDWQQETVLDVVLDCSESSQSSEEEIRAPAPQKSPKAREKSQEKMDENRAKPQGSKVTQPSPPEPQVLVPQRPKTDAPEHRPCTARVFKLKPAEAGPSVEPQVLVPQRPKTDAPEHRPRTARVVKLKPAEAGPSVEPQVLVPQRPKTDAPEHRPRTARVVKLKPAEAGPSVESGNITRPTPREPQRLLPLRPRMDRPVLRPCTANQSANDGGSTNQPQSGSTSEPPPVRPRVVLPDKPRSGVERVYGLMSRDAYKKLPPVHLKSANDVGWYPEKAKILWDLAIQRFIDKSKIRKPREPKVPQPKPPKSGIERIYGLMSKDAYKNVPQRRKTTTTKPSPRRGP